MKNIAVFCASSEGLNPIYLKTAYETGKAIARAGYGVVYGGAAIGCMGAVAQGALDHQGKVIGVLPHFLNKKEVAHQGLSELIMVESMHERKLKMNELSNAIITLPGGFGTFEELFEIITWEQLGLHQKPTIVFNVNNFYDHLLSQLKHMCTEGLLKQKHFDLLSFKDNIDQVLKAIEKNHAFNPLLKDSYKKV